MKTCTQCGKRKRLSSFYIKPNGKPYGHCKACQRERTRAWREANPEKQSAAATAYQRRRYTQLKLEVVAAYGGCCSCCGEEEIHFLTIEHIGGVPEHHKRADGKRLPGSTILARIKNEGFPNYITVLCFNCNCSLGMFGFCPHQPHDESDRRYPQPEAVS